MKIDPGLVVAQGHGIERSSKWPAARARHLKLEPKCAACDCTETLEVHHIVPFHFCVDFGRPELELDDRNLITLCCDSLHEHHILLGHLDSYPSYNKDVRAYVKSYAMAQKPAILMNAQWKSSMLARPKPLHEMTAKDKSSLVRLMNRLYPRK